MLEHASTVAGSTAAERTKKALKLVGKQRLEDVAEDHPEDALRAYIKRNHKPYNDESPVCSDGPADRKSV